MLKNILIKIEYQGTHYHGWQIQPNDVTVQEKIQDVLRLIFQTDITVKACSRTDSGVHARGQLANFEVPINTPLRKLFCSLNSLLPDDISVVDLVEGEKDYSVREQNRGKRYIYRINNSRFPRAIGSDQYWWVKSELDEKRMQRAAQDFIGSHDFSAFRGVGCVQNKVVKTIKRVEVTAKQEGHFRTIECIIEGSGFLKNMVRIMVGTLVDIGRKTREIDTVTKAFNTLKRTDAGQTAPPEGLTLDKVFLSPDPFIERTKGGWDQ